MSARTPTSRVITPEGEDLRADGKPTPRKYAACREGECIATGCRQPRQTGVTFLDPTTRDHYTIGLCEQHDIPGDRQ